MQSRPVLRRNCFDHCTIITCILIESASRWRHRPRGLYLILIESVSRWRHRPPGHGAVAATAVLLVSTSRAKTATYGGGEEQEEEEEAPSS